ncbi:unnamed protein product [Spirodela intermedia]|uniref:Uncharacterized protein n=1 Tax=Spirodela intermedia TaxID=51605 RepID=A0A7I8JIR8_SPIIN|nr:unnamed protein product [Spirodela intermedia]CAA6670054.1 unnamed protein product [Spirodela intermedia]
MVSATAGGIPSTLDMEGLFHVFDDEAPGDSRRIRIGGKPLGCAIIAVLAAWIGSMYDTHSITIKMHSHCCLSLST